MDQDAEHSLIRKAQAGDRRAFEALLRDKYRFLFATAWKWCGVREDAEDIAQDCAIKLAVKIGEYRFQSAFTTWLYPMVVNTAKDYYKAKNRRHLRETPMQEDAEFVSPDQTPEQKAQDKDVLRAVMALPEDLKTAVLLVCWDGLSHKEAAVIMQCKEGTISWRLHEARQKISALMKGGREASHG